MAKSKAAKKSVTKSVTRVGKTVAPEVPAIETPEVPAAVKQEGQMSEVVFVKSKEVKSKVYFIREGNVGKAFRMSKSFFATGAIPEQITLTLPDGCLSEAKAARVKKALTPEQEAKRAAREANKATLAERRAAQAEALRAKLLKLEEKLAGKTSKKAKVTEDVAPVVEDNTDNL